MTSNVIQFPVPPSKQLPTIPEGTLVCSFCHHPGTEVRKLLRNALLDRTICSDCVAVCNELVKDTP